MRKGIKKVITTAVGILSTLLVALITLPLLASLLINLPGIQNVVVRRVMSNLSERLGTTVSIDRINIKFINRIVVDGFYVEDFQGDTLLYSRKLTAPIVELGLMGEPLTFGKVRLEGTEMWLRRDSTGMMNIKHIVNAIRNGRPENPGSNFRLKIDGIEADSLTFGLLRWDKPFREGVDFSRFIIRNTNVDIDDFSIAGDTIRIGVRSLSFDERSGFRVDNISARHLVIAPGAVLLDNARIKAPGADLDLPEIRLKGDGWLAFREFTDSVSVGVRMRRSHLTSDFTGWFLPAVRGWGLTFDDLTLSTDGPVAALSGGIEQAHILGSSFALDFSSRGMPDFDKMHLDANIRRIETNGRDIDSLMRSIAGGGVGESVAKMLDRLGTFGFSGRFSGSPDDFRAEGKVGSEAGELVVAASVSMRGTAGSAVDGRVSVPRLDAGRLLAVEDMGVFSGDFRLNGRLDRGGHVEGAVEGGVKTLEYRGYTYSDMAFDGHLDDKMFDGTIHSRDPNLDFDFSGILDFNDSIPRYNFGLDLRRADFAATGLNRADSVSLLSARVTASASGDNFDNLNGRIEIRDPMYVSPSDTVRTHLVSITGRNSAASKYISLSSEFADAEFRSRISYLDMFAYLGDFLRGYIPLLYDGGETSAPVLMSGKGGAADYSVLSLRVKNTDRLLNALMPGTQVAEGSEVSFMFNPFVRSFSLSARSEYIEFGNMLAGNIELDSDNKADSLTLHLTSRDFYSGSLHIPGMAIHGGARGRRMSVSTRLEDTRGNFSALLGLRIDSGDGNGDRSIRFRFSPSYITLDQQTWYIGAQAVVYEDSRVLVDDFRISSGTGGAGELTVDGIISDSPSDTLRIRLDRFDLSPLGQFTEGSGYRLGGMASGYIDFMSMLKGARMNAGMEFDGLSVNDVRAAPLTFTSLWDRASERVRFGMLNRNTGADVLRGSFTPSGGRIDAVATIDSVDVRLLDPLLSGILENTEGTADFHINLGGTLKRPEMNGRISVPRFETTVKFTQASYKLENEVIEVRDSRLRLPAATVGDHFGNTGTMSMTVDMSNLRNVGVEIDADVNNLLAFDTEAGDNEAFYGRVFATGSLSIRVDRMKTRMGISAATERGTRFHLPLNAKSNIYWADFVRFADPRRTGIDTTDVLARKKLIYERRLQGDSRARSRKPFDLDMTIAMTPAAEFHMLIDPNMGRGISAHGNGVINMRINPATNLFSMTGDYTINDGRFEFSMMNVFNKDFTITPGSTLVWTGEPEDAILNVEAVYRVRTSLTPLVGDTGGQISSRPVPVDCIIRLTERLSQPRITFDLRLPSADTEAQLLVENAMSTQELKSTQFLSLLMMGSFAPGNSIGGQNATSGAAASGAVGFDILSSQLSNFLSNEDYNIYFRYRPQDVYTGNQFDVGFSTGFIDNRLILEIEGNYVEDRSASGAGIRDVSNLSGDVFLTWVIDRAGNLKLKAFSQTIDRWGENQGLQESGMGIYYKKDFNSFRDIFRRNKDTFTNFGSNGRADSVRSDKKTGTTRKKKGKTTDNE